MKLEALKGDWISSPETLVPIAGAFFYIIVWPLHLFVQRELASVHFGPESLRLCAVAYFSSWVYLYILLARKGMKYKWMIMDSLCIGLIISTAIVPGNSLSNVNPVEHGVNWWMWALVVAVFFITHRLIRGHVKKKRPQQEM